MLEKKMDYRDLNNLHSSILELEEKGLFIEADYLHQSFMKTAGKKFSKKKKNVPTNPSLWAECKAWAKRTFDVYPSAYANGAAAKRYKSKGGKWKKASSNNVKVAQISAGGETFYGYGDEANKLMSSINVVANNPTNKIDDYIDYYEKNKNKFNPDEQTAIEKTIQKAKASRERQGTFTSDVYQPYDVLGNKPDPVKPEPDPVRPDPLDRWSDYYTVPYRTVIETAKRLLEKGDKNNAKSMINAVSVNSKLLTGAEKEALKKHFDRILMSYTELGRPGSATTNNAYQDANNLIYNLKRKYRLDDKDLTIGSTSYGLIMNEINKYVSPVKNPDLTRRTKQIALQLLRTLSMDNRA